MEINTTPTTTTTTVTKTCVECMRRKIRTLTTAAAATGRPNAAEILVAKLFPGHDPASLAHLPTQELIDLSHNALLSTRDSSAFSEARGLGDSAPSQEGESDSERGWQEARLHHEVCDDVNGLSLNVHRRSYLGGSSIHAVIRAMFHVKPFLQSELQNSIPIGDDTAGTGVATPALSTRSHHSTFTPPLNEEAAINAYFADIHGIVPLLDEDYFRGVWQHGERCDRPWLALLNMVLVLGSLAVGDDESSHIYYTRAQPYLNFDLLGTGCLESLQALCLLGGLYLHIKNTPNTAYAIMGLAYRIAIGLGLHRQPIDLALGGTSVQGAAQGALAGHWQPQIRRQIWWSLFCLDTWGSMSLGRPTLGRWDPKTMNVHPVVNEFSDVSNAAISLDSASKFCIIATKIQHRLAHVSPMKIDEVVTFDGEVQSWYNDLPPQLLDLGQCPASLLSAQYIMRNRYHNLRLLLYRTVLLRYAHAGVQLEILPALEQDAVRACRDIACEAIEQAALSMQTSSKILICSAVWYLYQASMALLLGIMVDPNHPDSSKWRQAVEKAISLLASAIPWSRSAVRSKRVVESLLRVCDVTPASPSRAHDIGNLEGLPGEALWDLLGLDMFTDEGWSWDASEWIDWTGMGYN